MICQAERKDAEMFARACDEKSETGTTGVGWAAL